MRIRWMILPNWPRLARGSFYFSGAAQIPRDPTCGFRLHQIRFECLYFVGVLRELFEQLCLFDDRISISPTHWTAGISSIPSSTTCERKENITKLQIGSIAA